MQNEIETNVAVGTCICSILRGRRMISSVTFRWSGGGRPPNCHRRQSGLSCTLRHWLNFFNVIPQDWRRMRIPFNTTTHAHAYCVDEDMAVLRNPDAFPQPPAHGLKAASTILEMCSSHHPMGAGCCAAICSADWCLAVS
jgi:hypothetical protein